MEFNLKYAVEDSKLLLEYRNAVINTQMPLELGKYVEKYEKLSLNYIISLIGYSIMSLFDKTYKEQWHAQRGKEFLNVFTKELTQNAIAASLRTHEAASAIAPPAMKNAAPIGLPNIGNSCYLNSVTQMILSMDEVDKNELIATIPHKELRDGFKAVAAYVKKSDATTDGLIPLMTALRDSIFKLGLNYFPKESQTEQQDAQELLNVVLDGLFVHFDSMAKVNGRDRDQFKINHTAENVTMIPLAVQPETFVQRWVPFAQQSIDSKLQTYCNETINSPDGARNFSKLDGAEASVGNFSINKRICEIPPKYLFMHMVRQDFSTGVARKVTSRVNLPDQLDLSSIATDEIKEKCKGKLMYEPAGVVFHYGNQPTSGHYTANVKKDGAWHDCNDSVVNPIGFNSIDNRNSYVVMFKRKEVQV